MRTRGPANHERDWGSTMADDSIARPTIKVPPLPTKAQVRRMLERELAREQQLEEMRAAIRRGERLPAPQIKVPK
jgi:hypothetical protein